MKKPITQPLVHFGLTVSRRIVMKSGEERDQISATEDVIAFEIEGDAVWHIFLSLDTKDICDYADNYKSKMWQDYAAATAAACTKAFLENCTTTSFGV